MHGTAENSTDSQVWTPEEVALYLRVHPHSVYRWLRSGKLRGLKAGPQWRITYDDLQAYLRRETRERR